MSVYQTLSFKTQVAAKTLAGRLGYFGIDPFFDIRSRGFSFSPRIIFDVGAYHGHVAARLAARFRGAEVLAFEPSRSNFRELEQRAANFPRIRCVQIALSSSKGAVRFSDNLRVQDMSRLASSVDGEDGYSVQATTIDDFCHSKNIAHIDYLKIDTEGHDQDVLLGSKKMLLARNIDFVEVEAGVNPENTFHVPLEVMKNYLENLNYRLFGIYEQVHEWPDNQPNLRRVNAVFIPNPRRKEY